MLGLSLWLCHLMFLCESKGNTFQVPAPFRLQNRDNEDNMKNE